MPGNESEDRVHNFFAQDGLFQGQQQSQAAEDRGEDGYLSVFKHGPNFTQSSLRPHSAKGPNELQPNMNSFGYGNMFHQSGQNEESLLAMGISRGLPFPGLQQSVPNHFTNSSVSSETPLSAVGFDLFNGQQQTIHQQSSMPQFLQPQPSGTNDLRTLHQQLMSRRLQEFQRQQQQQQVQQFDSRQHHSVNQSTWVNLGTSSDIFQYPSSTEDGSNWIYQSSPNMDGSADGLGYPPNIIQTQQFDQSVYGAPISSSRRLPAASDFHVMPNRSSIPQSHMPVSNSYGNDDQHNLLTDRVQITTSKNEAVLDPEEKMFLFSSDDNLPNAFGTVPRFSEESLNIFGDGGLSNGLAGSWSALMQSTVAETSGNATPKEFGLNFEDNNDPVGKEQHLDSSLLQTSAASLHPNQAGIYTDTPTPSGVSSGWNSLSAMLPGSDGLNILQNSQSTPMQGGMSSLWKQNPALSYDTELGYVKSGHDKGMNDPLAQSHNPARTVNANSFVQNNSLFNQWRSAYLPASSQEGKSSQKIQNLVLGSLNSCDGDKTDKCDIEKHDGKENPSERHHSSLNQYSPHGHKEGGPLNANDPRSPSPGRQNSSNQLSMKVSAPRKFRYHPMGNADENAITERKSPQPSQARAMSQQNAQFGRSNLFNQVAMNSTVPKKGHSHELPGDANDAKNKSSDRNPSHQALTVPTSFSQNMLELLHKVDQEKDRTAMTQNMFLKGSTTNQTTEAENSRQDHHLSQVPSSVQQGFGLHLGPPSQRLQLSQNNQLSRNISSAFISGIPNSKNHLQSQQLTMPRVQKSINSGGQHQLVQSQIQPLPYQNILESSSAPSMEAMEEDQLKESSNRGSESVSTDRVPEVKASAGKELALKNHFKNSPANSSSMLEEINDLGQSLRPSSFSDQPYSFPSQTQALRNAVVEVGPKSLADAPVTLLKDGSVDIVPRSVSQHGNTASQDSSVLGSAASQSHSYTDRVASARVEYHKGDHQMAPPWSSSYGSLKNEQVLQIHDARKVNFTTRPGEHMSALGKSTSGSNALNSDEKGTSAPLVATEVNRSSPTSAVDGHYSPSLPQLNVTGQKKRKNDTFGIQPWHKEISDDSCYLKTHSTAEADWSKAVKRAAGKVDDIAKPKEDASLVLRAKKRLMTSSRLMQQLIGPLPETILSVDAISSYDVAPYSTSRVVLGDACHAVSSASNVDGSSTNLNLPPEKRKSPARNGAQRHEKASKELAERVAAIKGKLPSLEKSASSLLELRTECRDLEKHTILNRFLRIHVGGQTDNAETASTNTSTRKPSLQRLVEAAPVTENAPKGVKCLSL